jgi:hypothetical protein
MRSWRGAALLVMAILLLPVSAAALEVRLVPPVPRQGDAVLMTVAGSPSTGTVEGRLDGRSLRFYPVAGGHAAVGGIDIEARPGRVAWDIVVRDGRGVSRRVTGRVSVRARDFPVQRLTLPAPMVDLDPETERRARAESAALRALYDTVTPERLWRGPFAAPLDGDRKGDGFGARRIINGQPRMPHGGLDFAADRGTPVRAANRGRVVLIGDFFFPGRVVAIDHGLGLYSLYMHLDRVDVEAGALVERATVIGAVGATGRATGPHLHWSVQVGPSRVDPETLLAAPLRD